MEDKKDEKGKKFDDNAFQDAQDDARDGEASKSKKDKKEKKPSNKAKDDLRRAKDADKEWSHESDQYRRDNA